MGAGLFLAWSFGVLLGALAARTVGDVHAFGVDAAFPALILSLTLPALRERDALLAVLLGAAIAVGTTPLLPAGVPVLLVLCGLAVLAARRKGGLACR